MADGVVIKIDGDDSGFREKIAAAGDVARSALAGVSEEALTAGRALDSLSENSSLQTLSNDAAGLLDALAEASALLGGDGLLGGARDTLEGVYDRLYQSAKDEPARETDKAPDISADFSQGLKDGGDARGRAEATVSAVVAALESGQDLARAAGANVGQGFADGISSKLGAAIANAAALARAAIDAINAAAENASPSKAARRSGGFVSRGFALGIAEGVPEALKVSRDIGRAGLAGLDVDGLQTAAGLSYSAINRPSDGIDYERLADAASNRPVELYINSRAFARAAANENKSALDARSSILKRGRGG